MLTRQELTWQATFYLLPPPPPSKIADFTTKEEEEKTLFFNLHLPSLYLLFFFY
jgi:hypothetical protein